LTESASTATTPTPGYGAQSMKKEQIQELFARFEAASGAIKGVECWSARELQTVLGYTEWRNFTTVIDKASEACEAAGEAVSDHFVGINNMVDLGQGTAG
jgi:DNA-damage-inducible protein D